MEPQYVLGRLTFTIPVAVGLSIGDYYELATQDHAFGFTSVAGVVTVPLQRSSTFGVLSVRGSLQYSVLGTTTKAFNGGDRSVVVGSIGLAFSR
jgi:hypothetical protein